MKQRDINKGKLNITPRAIDILDVLIGEGISSESIDKINSGEVDLISGFILDMSFEESTYLSSVSIQTKNSDVIILAKNKNFLIERSIIDFVQNAELINRPNVISIMNLQQFQEKFNQSFSLGYKVSLIYNSVSGKISFFKISKNLPSVDKIITKKDHFSDEYLEDTIINLLSEKFEKFTDDLSFYLQKMSNKSVQKLEDRMQEIGRENARILGSRMQEMADKSVKKMGDRVEGLLIEPTLDNFQGVVIASFIGENKNELSLVDGSVNLLPRSSIDIEVSFITNVSEELESEGFSQVISIMDGRVSDFVAFEVAIDSDTIDIHNQDIQRTKEIIIDLASGTKQALNFSFAAPDREGKHDIWVEIYQKNRLIYNISTLINILKGN